MWQEFFKFDLRFQLRQPLLWITTAALLLIAFLTAGSDGFRIGGSIGNIQLNAPSVIARQMGVLSIIAMFLVTAFIAGAILRDNEVGIADMLFATPMRKLHYLLGRSLAGFMLCLLIFALIALAMMLGSATSSVDPERIGPFLLFPYLWAYGVFVVPNLLFIAALLILLAAATRSMIMVYVGVLGFVVLWGVAGVLLQGNADSLAVLLDPFGVRALHQLTRYFSVAQANAELPALSGLFLANRVVWSVLALAMFGATVVLFKPQRAGSAGRWFGKTRAAAVPATAAISAPARRIAPRFAASTAREMLDVLRGGINAMLVIILIVFSGELIFRERQVRIADLVDALPVPNWVPLLAKAGALIAVIFTFLATGVVLAIGIQLFVGGVSIDGMLYLQGTLINSVYFILMGLAILALQTIVNNKYLGYLLAIGLFVSDMLIKSLGHEHNLASFASLPTLVYSDMNGYAHFLAGWSWFALFWSLVTAALLIVAQAFWVRGLAQGWRARFMNAMRGLRGLAGLSIVLCMTACGATGSWILYNTHVLNQYQSKAAELDAQADYEKLYRKYLHLPNPSITAVSANVDIFPQERRVAMAGSYVLQNKTSAPLDSLRIQTDILAQTTLLNLPEHEVSLDDTRLGFKIIKLKQALAPGQSMPLAFTVNVVNRGFTNSGAPDHINHNGTLFASENYFPKLGYVQAAEIEDRNERKSRGLGEPRRLNKLEDVAAHGSNYWKAFGFDADLIDFETTVSTSADQSPMAPGTLLKSWVKDGRRYASFKTERPILPFFSYQSARWEVKQAQWNGLPINVYYDGKHAYNIDSMIKGTQRALSYYTDNFGPYQHKQLNILETPLYKTYARSFPNTIPFSESLGFVSDLRNPDHVDHVFYVTAHEVAHQWWGDQLIAANVQGAAMLSESLAEYSALMTVEKEFGAEKTRHILRFDLDQYFAGRAKELVEELPLNRTEGQTYLHYRKGSLAFYRLREEIGEQAVNRALKRFLDENRYKTAPYPTSTDLIRYLRAEAPQDKQELITDLFERIVVYDNRVLAASARKRADGQWDVTLQVRLAKAEADGKGKETKRAYNEPIDIAVFGRADGAAQKDERVLFRGKRTLPAGESTITLTVRDKPYEAGVDPYNLLIDRLAGDNRKKITVEGAF